MKKTLIAGVILLAVVAMGLPPAFGMVIEDRLTEGLKDGGLSESISIRIGEFERGLYSSSAVLTLKPSDEYLATLAEVADQQAAREVLEALSGGFDLRLDISHGPLSLQDGFFVGLVQVTTRIDSNTPYVAEILESLEVPYLLKIRAQVGFFGSVTFQGDVPPFSLSSDEGSVEFSGLDVDGIFDAANRSLASQVRLDSISGNADNASFAARDLKMATDQIMSGDSFWIGDSNFLIGSLEGVVDSGPSESTFKIDRLGIGSRTSLNDTGDQFSMAISFTLEGYTGIEDTKIEDAEITIGLSRINLQAMTKLTELVQAMKPQAESALELMAPVYDVLAGSPRLSVDPITFRFNEGTLSAKLSVDVTGSDLPPLDQLVQLTAANPMALSRLLSGSGRIEAPESLVGFIIEQVAIQQSDSGVPEAEVQAMAKQQRSIVLTKLLQQQMLIRDADKLSASFEYGSGILTINGKVIPLGGS